MPDLISKCDYKKLLADLQRIIREGKQEAERAATQALIESYWSIGKRIAKEKLNTRAAYHSAILSDLSADLDIGVRTLQRTVTFYRTYKRPPRPTNPSYLYKAELHDIIDADTLYLDIDLGFEVIRRQNIRLARVDSPHATPPKAPAAAATSANN